MGQIPVARAEALPGRDVTVAPPSPWQSISRHARDRAGQPAFVVFEGAELTTRTWGDTARAVECAAAGLVRSGLRVDQVVVSLLPSDHPRPELDLALRTVGAVVVHVGPHATRADIERDLGEVRVRLVVAESVEDLDRVEGLPLAHAEMFTLDGGRGWDRLLELGAERLVMDPTVVERTDRTVDHRGSDPRLLAGPVPIGREPGTTMRAGVLGEGGVTLAVGEAAEPLLRVAREAQLVHGFALCVVRQPSRLGDVVRAVRPHVVVAPGYAADAMVQALAGIGPVPAARSRRTLGWRQGGPARSAVRPAPGRGPVVVVTAVTDEARDVVAGLGGAVEVVEVVELLPPDLPQPPPVVLGDVTLLPRRSRRAPGEEFELRLGAEPEPEESAFSLPSLPLMTGESFLDKLLLSRAHQADE